MSGGPPLPPKAQSQTQAHHPPYEGADGYAALHNRQPSGSVTTASPAFSASSASASRSSDYSAGTKASDYYQEQQWPAYTEPDAPPRPPRNSYWHRTNEELQASSDSYAWAPNDRPISSATGIISLYAGGDDEYRRGSSGSIESETSTRVPSRRTSSRPLPTLPQQQQQQPQQSQAQLGQGLPSSSSSSSQNGLFVPALDGMPHSRSVSPYAPVVHSSSPSPLPYSSAHHTTMPYSTAQPSLETPPMPQMDDGYFGSSALSPHRNGESTDGPVWSPTTSAFTSAQASPVANFVQPSLHRSQHSLGALSALSADSWVSGDGEGPHRRVIPHLRVQSEDNGGQPPRVSARTSSTSKKRAPLPPLPSRPSQGSYYGDQDLAATVVQDDLVSATGRLAPFAAPGDQRPSSAMSHSSTIRPSYQRQDSWTSVEPPSAPQPWADEAAAMPRRAERVTRTSFVDFCQLSHLALLLRDAIPRGSHVKGSISYPNSFTGKDLVSSIQSLIPRKRVEAAAGLEGTDLDEAQKQAKIRQLVLGIARSLKSQLFFHEVDWGNNELQDGVDEVYLFLEDSMAQNDRAARGGASEDFGFTETNLDLSLSYDSSQRDHPVSSSGVDELPTGVIVQLTTCYSPGCGREGAPQGTACYSPSCPRSARPLLQRAASATTQAATTKTGAETPSGLVGAAGGVAHKAWAELVPPEVLASLPKSEITRQNAILEHIQKEEDFLADLELLENLFIKGLEKPNANGDPPPIGIGPERDDFIREVFGNHRELVAHVKVFVEKLHIRQREESPIIRSIGDIFLDAALEWQDAFVTYVSAYPIAKSRITREQSVNSRFRDFLEACRRDPACRRLGLDNFIHRALPHLQRHPLLLQTIIDKTDETNPDRESCVRAKEVIVQQCKTADVTIQEAQIKAKIRGFAYNLQTKRNKAVVDMDLLNPERQLMHEGRVYRRPDFTDLDWTELQAVLFDNYFMVTKMKAKPEGGEDSAAFVLAKRPIPVEMLEMSGFNEPSVTFSIGLNALHLRHDRESRSLWPFTIHHLGGKLEPLTLYATSKQRRLEWRTKIDEAKGLRMSVVEANKAFDSVNVCDAVFALPTALSGLDPEKAPPGVSDASIFHGRVTCAVPFSMADRRKLMALGCADGVWIGLRNDPSSFRKVLHLKLVTQCAVLEEFGIFVVLADKVLISYSLEALVPMSTGGAVSVRPPQKLSGNRGVLFFGVGVLKDRTLLVYMKKKANESVFKALEPVVNQPSASSGGKGGNLFNKIKNDMSGKGADWFRMYKVFFIPSEAYSMQFLRNKLAVVCARGFEIMNLDTLLPGTIPDFSRSPRDDPRVLALARRVETSKPLGMFKLSGTDSDFLLCYDGFACYVDRSGEPIRLDNIVEWEGTPQSVAFCAPFILAFDARFVEVREALSGRLVQMVRAHDLKYISSASIVEGSHAEHSIVCVQRARSGGAAAGAGATSSTLPAGGASSHTLAGSYDVQQIFELLPTAPYAASSLARKDTTGTASTGLLSYSSSSRSSGNNYNNGKMRRYYEEGPRSPLASSFGGGSSSGGSYGQDYESGGIGGGGGGGGGARVDRNRSTSTSHHQQQQQYQQQQGFATRTIQPGPPTPAGWI